jgi:hypothetical protein
MAGVLQPNLGITCPAATNMDFGAGAVIPAGKYESCCLLACALPGVTITLYVGVYWFSAASGVSTLLMTQEPIRYRTPGGNPVLLQDYILGPGEHLILSNNSAAGSVNFYLYNRWRFDA